MLDNAANRGKAGGGDDEIGGLLRRPCRGGAMAAQRGDQRVGLGLGHIEAADKAGERGAPPIELNPSRSSPSITALGSSRNSSLASTGATSLRPATSPIPAAIRAAAALDACASLSHSPSAT